MDTARLILSVATSGFQSATGWLDKLTSKGAQAERATSGVSSSFASMAMRSAGAIAGVVGITASIADLVSTTREFEKLRAGLTTATGSKELGAEAFTAIQDFATKTPYDLQQVTSSFIKLVNLGLTPSERALYSYGNTASALGKDLNMMVEAVADAATGEFERLKEFGIKASKEGDKVTFRFRGVTTTVKNSAEDIENYLIQLGETNFGDGMKNQMETLDGSLSNLGDSWSQLLDNINKAGVGDVIKDSVDTAIEVIDELNSMLQSGEMQGYLEAIGIAWGGWADDVQGAVEYVNNLWKEHGDKTDGVIKFLIDAFQQFPENVRAYIQIVVTDVAAMVDRVKAYGEAMVSSLNPFNSTTDIEAQLKRRLQAINEGRDASVEAILEERDATLKAVEDKITVAKMERMAWDATNAARDRSTDRLEKYGVKKSKDKGPTDDEKKAAEKAKQDFQKLVENLRSEEEQVAISYQERNNLIYKFTREGSVVRDELLRRSTEKYNEELKAARGKELEDLQDDLMSEEEKIAQSYARRLEIIRRNTEEGSAVRATLESQAFDKYQKELEEKNKQRRAPVDAIKEAMLTEEQALRESYEKRAMIIRDSTEISEKEKQEIMMRLSQEYLASQKVMELQRTSDMLSASGQMFDGLAGIAEQYAGKQSGIFKAMFAVSKAFAIADSIVKIQQAMASAAMSAPFPANLGAMASVAAATMSIISTIQGANFNGGKVSGAYDLGGMIPAGKKGIVGEYGLELVNGPAVVTGRKQTANKLAGAAAGGANVQVVVNNYSGEQVQRKETQDDRGNRRVELTIGEMVGGEMRRPGSGANQSLRSGFGLQPTLIRRG